MRLNHIVFTPLLWLVSAPLLAASLPEVSEKSCANSQIISSSIPRNKLVECRYTFRAEAYYFGRCPWKGRSAYSCEFCAG